MVETIEKRSVQIEKITLDGYFGITNEKLKDPSEKLPVELIPGKPIKKIGKVSSGRLTNKRIFESQYLKELQGSVSQDFSMPEFLLPYVNYPCNEEFLIHGGSILVKCYGEFNGESFGKKHLTRENIDRVLAIHDASHSVALFLKNKDTYEMCEEGIVLNKAIAVHSIVPFVFPTSLPYLLYYTQKYHFPLVTTEVVQPVRELLSRNLLMKQFKGSQGGRWCTRVYKIEPSRYLFKEFNLKGIVQLKGITKHQSDKRNKMYEGKAVDLTSQEALLKRIKNKIDTPADYERFFHVFQKLPIFEMLNSEIDELLTIHGIQKNPAEVLFQYKTFDWLGNKVVEKCAHGCMLCPFRDQMWYHYLKYRWNGLYNQCNEWRVWASEKRVAGGKNEYYYFFDPSKPGKGSKIM
jgi:3'-phosphoadenosine 5'-phosphosulfate sulfotransferase (PAPS reductase)/FAD synthetase